MIDSLSMTENDFDWVTKRLNCTVEGAFAQLRAGAELNVAARNESSSNGDRFSIVDTAGSFVVVKGKRDWQGHAEVKFKIGRYNTGNENVIISNVGVKGFSRLNVQPRLNTSGECVLTIDGVETTLWRVLYLALEGIFFQPDDVKTSVTMPFA